MPRYRSISSQPLLIRIWYVFVYHILRIFWFVFRPHTFGSKVVIERDGKVLLVKHSYGPAAWSFPGGGKKQKETFEEAAIREAKEEVGVRVTHITFIGNFVSHNEYKYDHVHVFLAKADGEVVIDGREIIEYAWATHDFQTHWTPLGEKIWHMYQSHYTSR